MHIFDSHCHPQFPQYDADREEMIKRNLEKGVFMIAVGADLKTSAQAVKLAEKYERIWAAVGLHPDEITGQFRISDYELLLQNKKVVAVGEIGLDYYRTSEPEKQERQKEVFRQFIELALKHDKALIIHARDAGKGSAGKIHSDTLAIISSYLTPSNIHLRGVAHSFTGSIPEAMGYIKLGFCIGLNGIITFSEEYDELVKTLPINKILLETDAPWLTPAPNRGKRNEPTGVIDVAKRIAHLHNAPLEIITNYTFKNTTSLFKIRISPKFEVRLVN